MRLLSRGKLGSSEFQFLELQVEENPEISRSKATELVSMCTKMLDKVMHSLPTCVTCSAWFTRVNRRHACLTDCYNTRWIQGWGKGQGACRGRG